MLPDDFPLPMGFPGAKKRAAPSLSRCVTCFVASVFRGGKSQRQVAEDLGVAMSTLSRWYSEQAANGERAFVGSGHLQPEAEELRRLRRENDVLRQERGILRKALAIFSHP